MLIQTTCTHRQQWCHLGPDHSEWSPSNCSSLEFECWRQSRTGSLNVRSSESSNRLCQLLLIEPLVRTPAWCRTLRMVCIHHHYQQPKVVLFNWADPSQPLLLFSWDSRRMQCRERRILARDFQGAGWASRCCWTLGRLVTWWAWWSALTRRFTCL